jgi:hypothetical protein
MEASVNSLSASDLFKALDGHRLLVSARSWRIEIYGVFEQQGSRWIQLVLRGSTNHNVAVKVGPRDTDTQVLDALSSWFADPSKPDCQVRHLG